MFLVLKNTSPCLGLRSPFQDDGVNGRRHFKSDTKKRKMMQLFRKRRGDSYVCVFCGSLFAQGLCWSMRMMPSVDEVAGQSLNGALQLLRIEEANFAELFAAICGPTPPSLQIFGLLSAEAVQRALEPKPSDQKRSLALLWRAARRREGLPDQDLLRAPPVVEPAPRRLLAYKVPKSHRSRVALQNGGPLIVTGACYSHGLDALRAVFSAGTNLAAPVPRSRWDHNEYYDPQNSKGIGIYAKHAACIGLPQPVDAAFFGLEEEEALNMDPMQRSCLAEGFRAVRDSKLTRQSLRNSPCGVYVGSMNFDHAMSEAGLYDGGNVNLLASRLSHVLGLRGPSLFLDTGCSASLVAADIAASHLRRGRASFALALGVNHLLSPLMFHGRCAINLLSRVGHSAPFNATADGYVVGEGCGAIVLGHGGRRRGHGGGAIYRGSQVMQDGRSAQLTAPSGPAQQELLRETWQRSGVSSWELAASECQANGSLLGDPIEMGAIEKVHQLRQDPFLLMSGKCNKGHGEGVAGMTTLLKILFFIQDQHVPPQIHFNRLNPHIDAGRVPMLFCGESFALHGQRRSEESEESLRALKACGSSFGFGGVNAHVVLEAMEAQPLPSKALRPRSNFSQPAVTAGSVAVGSVSASKLPMSEARQLLRKVVAAVVEQEAPAMDVPLAESGLDSLAAVQLRNTLQRQTSLALPSTMMFDYPTMQEMAEFISSQALSVAPSVTPSAAPMAPAAAATPIASVPPMAPTSTATTASTIPLEVSKVISGAVRAALEETPHVDTPLTEMGLDSLAAAQLRNQLQSSFRVKLPATLLFEHPSVAELSSFVSQTIQEQSVDKT
eukprot:s202_g11.t1